MKIKTTGATIIGKKIVLFFPRTELKRGTTCLKKLSVLSNFLTYLVDLEVVDSKDAYTIPSYNKPVKRNSTVRETLTIEDINKSYEYQFDKKYSKQIRDTFVFQYLSGMKSQDHGQFDAKLIKTNTSREVRRIGGRRAKQVITIIFLYKSSFRNIG